MKQITNTLILILVLISSIVIAQPQTNNWYFGNNAAVNFTSGSPVAVSGSAIMTSEGCSTISDASGNLLFYTDGITVWDRTNTQMPNGFSLGGNSSSTQSGVIVQKPGSTTLYYLFTADAMGGSMGICYSIVDMTLAAGMGDVIAGSKNTPVVSLSAEKITAVRHCNGVDVWIIIHDMDNNTFRAYLLSATGLSATSVNSNVGINYTNVSGYYAESIGYLKASPSGRKLAAAVWDNIDMVQVFDFDNSTGLISNPISIDYSGLGDSYGVSFSPNNNVLYVACWTSNLVDQYDLSSGNQATIIASRYQVASAGGSYGALQLGLDGKLYVTTYSNGFLSAINNPNVLGVGCNFVTNAVSLGTGTCSGGLPNFVDAINAVTTVSYLPSDTTVCSGPVTLNAGPGATSYQWSTGATTQTISVNATGQYIVTVTGVTTCNTNVQYDTVNVHIVPAVSVNLGNDTTLCTGQNLTLDAGNAGSGYSWSNGATTQTINVSVGGTYSVTVTAGTCTDVDTITVTFNVAPVVNLGNDTTLCAGQPITLDAGNAGSIYQWSNGATTQTISPTTTGNYWVIASVGTCTDRDTLTVTFTALPVVNLGPDQLLCGGQSVTLNAGLGTTYLWSDGSTIQTISVSTTGTYWVIVQNGTCAGTDTINVTTANAPTVNLGPDIRLCYGEVATLNAGNPGFNYFWSNGETTQNVQITSSGLYWVKVSNTGCTGTDSINVIIGKQITVELVDTFICPGDQMTITIDRNFKTYSWIPGGQGTYKITIDQPGTYRVSVTDTNNCPGSGSIFIDEFCPTNIYIPTAFSPNGNKMNDVFMAYGEKLVDFHMYVFDRWGELIFESTDISVGWNGNYNGGEAQQGTYVYRVDYKIYDYLELKKYTKYGVVNLIR